MGSTSTYPEVSIILPTYNRAGYILETIRSVQDQTFQNWELLIMDDGSSDDTETLVGRIGDKRIHFCKCPHTGMVSKLKNQAILLSRGELIAFIDSDDLWAKAKLERQVELMNQYPDAGFSLVGGYTFRKQNEPLDYFYKQRDGASFEDIFIPMFRSEISGFTQALLVRKKCLKTSGYFDEAKNFSDPDFLVSLASHFKAAVLFEPMLFRRLHEGSDSDEYWEQRYWEWIEVIRTYRRKKQLPAVEARNALFKLYINFGEKCLRFKQYASATRQFFNASKQRPFNPIGYKKIAKAMIFALQRK